ncbi:hypothetical protein MKX03_037376 [Papaver bracteatum]|nr:hypothetical protein MKX03_037376 [Papaver bracteatum]
MVFTSLILSPASTSSLFLPVSHSRLVSLRTQCCEDSLGRVNKKHINSENGLAKDFLVTPPTAIIPRPRRIILIRHGQSEGNVDQSVYTQKGVIEAEECGKRIRKLIESGEADDWQVYFYVSPYKRTLETLRGVGKAFESSRIAGVREEPRLREQDFGNFQDREQMRVEKAERILYGRFFYRFPNGESAADVYDRITGFRETLRADIDIGRFQPPGQRNSNMNLVIVSHGLTLRVFLMRWYSLLVHHTHESQGILGLRKKCLLTRSARPGAGPSFFKHFHDTWKQQ